MHQHQYIPSLTFPTRKSHNHSHPAHSHSHSTLSTFFLLQFPMGILLLHPLLILSLLINHPIFGASSPDPFSDALLSLKSEFVDHFNSLPDWLLPVGIQSSSRIHACSWTGIKCNPNSSQILSVDLSGKNLGGSLSGNHFSLFVHLLSLNISHNSFWGALPPGIFNLTSLTSLDISRNNFSGLFPSGIPRLKNLQVLDAFSNSFSGPLPADVSQVESLKIVNFAGSYFSGPIPSEYGSFRALEYLHLAGNFLTGSLPPELGNLKTLSHMEIGYNSYQGGIPREVGNMSELQYLDIADANISGPIPPQISNLTKLESLFLFKNELNGEIPEEFSTISTLKSLDLSDNLLSGPIPTTFSELKNLRLLSLMFNDLTGPVPPGIAKLPQLDTLLIWSNYLTGSLPEDLGTNSKLQHVDVSTNYFVGSIPPGICAGKELLRLILFSNNFTGGLHPSLSNCSSLIRLRLEDNSFSGEISLPFANLPSLSYADVSRNKFTGGIPPDIDKASGLEYLNVSYNPLGGVIIPHKTWSMPNLQNFSMISCGVSGSIPEFESCITVSVVELRMNNFSGRIPDSLSNCKQLVRIDLANNSLTGSIPENLASLPNLSVLDLSHNSFSGPIPAAFGTSPSLELVNVSHNDITGTIPSSKAFKMMDQSAFFGNPKLCGAPLRACHHANGISSGFELGSRRAQKVAWILILCAAVVLFLLAAVFGILYYDRVSKCQWKMVAFDGLPHFTAKDVLRSFNYVEALEIPPDSVSKVVLPTGITVAAKKVEWEGEEMKAMLQVLSRIGNARHKNLTRLLGICYNNRLAYLLYDYMPNGSLAERISAPKDWEAKRSIITGVAKALCFLHHHCYPAIPHGNLKSSNVLFDENMEPHLSEYGLKLIIESRNAHGQAKLRRKTGGVGTSMRDEVSMDVYNFGELILEVLTNGRVRNASEIGSNREIKEAKQVDAVIREVDGNEGAVSDAAVKSAIDLALLCVKSRPSMQEVVKLVQGCWELEEKGKPIIISHNASY